MGPYEQESLPTPNLEMLEYCLHTYGRCQENALASASLPRPTELGDDHKVLFGQWIPCALNITERNRNWKEMERRGADAEGRWFKKVGRQAAWQVAFKKAGRHAGRQ